MSGGELFTHLYNREHFTEDEAMFYTAEVAVALDFLHKVTNKNKWNNYLLPAKISADKLFEISEVGF